MAKKVTTQDIIERAKQIHGNLYDYSKLEYVDSKTKVCVIDPIYGEFYILPGNLCYGYGNRERGVVKSHQHSLSSTENFLMKVKNSEHISINYDFTKTVYENAKTKLCITDPVYGDFWIIPNSFLAGCGHPNRGIEISKSKLNLSTESFITKAKLSQPDIKYDFSKVVYKNNHTPVTIIDPIYGEFNVKPANFYKGSCHPKLRKEKRMLYKLKSTDEFITECRMKFSDIDYDYSKVIYEHSRKSITIIDPVYGEFTTTPNRFLNGQRHPSYSQYGYNKNIPGYFYINKILYSGEVYYKFGITNFYDQRFKQYNINEIESFKFKCFYCDDGNVIWEIESSIKNNSEIHRKALDKKFFKHGYTETVHETYLNSIMKIVDGSNLQEISLS